MNKFNKIITDIHHHGGTVYYVGGTVRDELLDRPNKDIDVEIHDISVEQTTKVLSKYGKVDNIGAAFGILMLKGLDVDFAFPRSEQLNGDKHTDFDVTVDPYLPVDKAAKRRDFTMNAIMKNAHTGEIIDPYDGLTDINHKTIKYVNKDTFVEDPLRSLRAAQFASRLGFKIDPSVIALAKTMDYRNLSKERVEVELNKALLSDTPSIAFNYLKQMGVLRQLVPELDALSTVKQDEAHHPEGSVWNHTMMVLDAGAQIKHQATNPLWFMYACLFHDIGKLRATVEHYKMGTVKVTSHGHDKIGAEMIPRIMRRITTESKLIKYVQLLAEYHMDMHWISTLTDERIRKIIVLAPINDLILLNQCDKLGRGGIQDSEKVQIAMHIDSTKTKVSELSTHGFGVIKPYIQGRDILALGVEPGPKVGRLLKEAFRLQLKGKSRDEVMNTMREMTVTHIVTSEDLKNIGYKPSKSFGDAKKLAIQMESEGYTREQIIHKLTQNLPD